MLIVFKNKITLDKPIRLALLITVLTVLLLGCTSLITPNVNTIVTELKKGQYRIDPTHTALIFKVEHLGLSTYVGRFNTVDATLDFDPNNLVNTRLNSVVKIGSVDVNNAKLQETLNGSSWFNTARYPEAIYKTLSVEVQSDNTFTFTGALTLLGVTEPVVLQASFNGGAHNILTGRYTLGFSATTKIQRSKFGMDKYIGIVGDQVMLEIYAEFLRE